MDINSIFRSPITNPKDLPQYVTTFVNIIFAISGVILLVFFILGGIGMMRSAGSDNPQQMEQSKKTLTSAVIGFIIVFAAYWIVKLIGLITGVTII